MSARHDNVQNQKSGTPLGTCTCCYTFAPNSVVVAPNASNQVGHVKPNMWAMHWRSLGIRVTRATLHLLPQCAKCTSLDPPSDLHFWHLFGPNSANSAPNAPNPKSFVTFGPRGIFFVRPSSPDSHSLHEPTPFLAFWGPKRGLFGQIPPI